MALDLPSTLMKGVKDQAVDNRVAPGTTLFSYSFSQLSFFRKCCIAQCCVMSLGLNLCCMMTQNRKRLLGVPDDAILLSPEEQLRALAHLQGHWKIVNLTENPGMYLTSYTDVVVEGHQYTHSGGSFLNDDVPYPNKPQANYFKVFRSADGKTTYLDHLGTRLESFDAARGEAVFLHGYDIRIMWRRDHGGAAVVVQPGKSLSDELQSLAQLHAQGALSAAEFERAKAAAISKHKQ